MRTIIAVIAGLLTAAGASAQQDSEFNPFTRQESELMSVVWPEIRETSDYDDIDWDEVGLNGPPGDREARELLEENWEQVRQAASFDEIRWEETVRYRQSSRFDRGGVRDVGPFTRQEADLMSTVWPQIREAGAFQQINWDAVGLDGAPGDLDARRVMAENWDQLRQVERFRDIDWSNVGEIRESRIR